MQFTLDMTKDHRIVENIPKDYPYFNQYFNSKHALLRLQYDSTETLQGAQLFTPPDLMAFIGTCKEASYKTMIDLIAARLGEQKTDLLELYHVGLDRYYFIKRTGNSDSIKLFSDIDRFNPIPLSHHYSSTYKPESLKGFNQLTPLFPEETPEKSKPEGGAVVFAPSVELTPRSLTATEGTRSLHVQSVQEASSPMETAASAQQRHMKLRLLQNVNQPNKPFHLIPKNQK